MDRIEDARLQNPAAARRKRRSVSVGLATTERERRAAQRLRWRVFADEMGARLTSNEPGLDVDAFDPFCDHLVARDDEITGVVGTYRLLPPRHAERLGCLYSDGEFDLGRIDSLRDSLVEVGRSCVHADYRTGAVIALLWGGLARYMLLGGYRYLAGCASVSMADGGHAAAAIFKALWPAHAAPEDYRVTPRLPLPMEKLDASVSAVPPPLLKGYLRCGAWLGGPPAWDPDFNTADFFILLPLARVEARYARHFLGRGGERKEQLLLS